MTYNIISTGSKGNAVIINDQILIDCGVPYRLLKNTLKNIKLVQFIHIHGGQYKPKTAMLDKKGGTYETSPI